MRGFKARVAWASLPLFVGGAAGFSIVMAPMILVLGALVGAAIALGQACFRCRQWVFLLALLWIFIQYFLVRDLNVLPHAGVWGDEACLGGLLLASLLTCVHRGRMRLAKVPIVVPLVLFASIGVVSGFANGARNAGIFLGLRGLLQGSLYYLVLLNLDFDRRFLSRVVHLIQGLVLIQIPFCVFQFATWHESKGYAIEDAAFGTFGFGTANLLGFLFVVFLFHFVYAYRNRLIRLIPFLFIEVLLFAGLLLTSSRFSLFLLGPLIAFSVFMSNLGPMKKATLLVGGIGVGMVVLLFTSMLFGADLIPTDREGFEELLESQTGDTAGGGRVFYFIDTLEMVAENSVFFPIGLGPGAYASYAGFTLGTPLLRRRLGFNFDNPGTSFDPDVTVVVGEYGLVGLVVFFWILGLNFRRNESLLKRITDPQLRCLGLTNRMFGAMMVLAPFTNGVWQCQFFAGVYWAFTGLLERAVRHFEETAA